MKCPFCSEPDTKVADTRIVDDGSVVKRRRYCECCKKRFITYERLDTIQISVTKRNGLREDFDRNKILAGLKRSCNKRSITMDQMEQIVSEIESMFIYSGRNEVESAEIGEMVMKRLKELDEVAYVRFASVYKQFDNIESFMEELSSLIHEKNPKG